MQGPDAANSHRVRVAAGNLRVDATTAEVFGAFSAAGVTAMLLKGPSISRWLYTDGSPRRYVDSDVLVPPDDLARAGEVLERLGFQPQLDENAMPDWWREHAAEWSRESDGAQVDLHRTLPGAQAPAETVWGALTDAPDTLAVGGSEVRTLDLPGRALHVALHAAQHGLQSPAPLEDLRRAVATVDDALWRDAAALAEAIDAGDAFTTGLRLTEAGRTLSDRLGLVPTASVAIALQATTSPPVALTIEEFASARGLRAKATVAYRRLFPPPAFMRQWAIRTTGRNLPLPLAYARRLLWLAQHGPRGVRAWREARRSVSGRSH
jgi:hypothetical protein